MMNRREAIKQVTAMLGGVALIGGGGLVAAVERAHARAARSPTQVGTFTAQDVALLDEVADTILPETKTPGAKAAHVGAFMMKELTLLGYFTSEIGCTQAMRYRETPGRFDPCVPYTPGETTWAGHA